MPGILHPPYLSYDDLRRRARDFLQTYHPSGSIPVPIEEIVEFEYEIDIIPVPGLHNAFEVDGFISSDLKALTVEELQGTQNRFIDHPKRVEDVEF